MTLQQLGEELEAELVKQRDWKQREGLTDRGCQGGSQAEVGGALRGGGGDRGCQGGSQAAAGAGGGALIACN